MSQLGNTDSCGYVKKKKKIKRLASHSPPLLSQEVFTLEEINLVTYLKALLKSFISLLTQAAQEG